MIVAAPSTQQSPPSIEDVEVCHFYDEDEWPIAYCGVDISDEDPECPEDCGHIGCPVCDAIDHLLDQQGQE